jgi:hypothetical protein
MGWLVKDSGFGSSKIWPMGSWPETGSSLEPGVCVDVIVGIKPTSFGYGRCRPGGFFFFWIFVF